MEPRNTLFHADVAGKEVCVLLDFHSRLLRGHPGDREVTGLAEAMGREVDTGLSADDGASVATQSPFGLAIAVAPHPT